MQSRRSMPGMVQRWPRLWLHRKRVDVWLTKDHSIIFGEVSERLSDSAQQWAEFTEVVDCSQESANSLLVLWNGHVDNGLNGLEWLKAISGNGVPDENRFPYNEFHFADV